MSFLWEWVNDIQWPWTPPVVEPEETSLISYFDLRNLNFGPHLRPFIWGLAMILFGCIVLAFDTRQAKGILPILRDRILGIEQRYFLVIFNGVILYSALVFLLQPNTSI